MVTSRMNAAREGLRGVHAGATGPAANWLDHLADADRWARHAEATGDLFLGRKAFADLEPPLENRFPDLGGDLDRESVRHNALVVDSHPPTKFSSASGH
jgi:hypothetical protein